jgi:hypothetical protein
MKFLISIIVFLIVLFLYLHVYFHLKTSNDLEIYELEDVSKERLEDVCNSRQPALLSYNNSHIMDIFSSESMKQYKSFDIKIRNTNKREENSDLLLPIKYTDSTKLFKKDSSYYSEYNNDFLQETGIIKTFENTDEYLKPPLSISSYYDFIKGTTNITTPLRYELNFRNFFYITSGSVELKICPPISSKYLHTIYDYENFEFYSPINPWNVDSQYINDFDKVKCIEVELKKGSLLFLPAYWWYSFKLNDNANIAVFKYRTIMNNVSISPYIGLHLLQINNIKHEITKKKTFDISDKKHREKKIKHTINKVFDISNCDISNNNFKID